MPRIDFDKIALNEPQRGAGDPIVLVHGLGMSSDLLLHQAR